ncbi:MAG: histone deacetylase [Bryobacteraceae bacterium]
MPRTHAKPSRRNMLQWSLGATLVSSAHAAEPITALLADPIYKLHDTGPGHPEQPARYDAVMESLAKLTLKPIESRTATDDEIALVHTRRYIDIARRDIEAGRSELTTGDTTISPRSLEVALKATGGVLNAIDAVVTRSAKNAFCAVRPPGHHARPDQGMGFCIFNSIAVAARYAQRKHGLDKVLIVDWDVHHGNGTQDTFFDDGSVFFFSTHQWPWYPGTGPASETGNGAGKGTTMNRPFPAGSGREQIVTAFREDLRRAADAFKPDLVLISAGFDSRAGDPLGDFTLSDSDFTGLTHLMLQIAGEHANGRLVSVLEGGYNLSGLASATAAHVQALVEGSAA